MERSYRIGHKVRLFRLELEAVLAHRIRHPAKGDAGHIIACLHGQHRMFPGAMVAHPRIWTPQERGLIEGVRYPLGNGPQLLLDQIALIGGDLTQVDDFIFIKSNPPSGLLYLFVNDVWQTAGNNSGGPRISIEPVNESDATGVLFTLEHRIDIEPDGKQNETNKWQRQPAVTLTV